MPSETLGEFILLHREELVRRCRTKVAARPVPPATPVEIERGIPRFLDDIAGELSGEQSKTRTILARASQHGSDLFSDGFSIGQVVHDYGAVCQSITDMAVELDAHISADDFRTLNRCLDDSIAFAVAEYSRLDKRLGGPEHSMTLRNLVETAMNAFKVLEAGEVGVGGATGHLVSRCLATMRDILSDPKTHM